MSSIGTHGSESAKLGAPRPSIDRVHVHGRPETVPNINQVHELSCRRLSGFVTVDDLTAGRTEERAVKITTWLRMLRHVGFPDSDKQRVLMHGHQGWNVRHGLCHIYMRYVYIYELFIAFVSFYCLFITVTWWYVWCFEWASGNQEEVQACLVTLWLFIISCYSLYKTTLGLLCSWFENNPHFHRYSMDFHV